MSLVDLDPGEDIPMDEAMVWKFSLPSEQPKRSLTAQARLKLAESLKTPTHPAGRRKSKRRFIDEVRPNERRTTRDARLFSCSGIRRGSRRRLREAARGSVENAARRRRGSQTPRSEKQGCGSQLCRSARPARSRLRQRNRRDRRPERIVERRAGGSLSLHPSTAAAPSSLPW